MFKLREGCDDVVGRNIEGTVKFGWGKWRKDQSAAKTADNAVSRNIARAVNCEWTGWRTNSRPLQGRQQLGCGFPDEKQVRGRTSPINEFRIGIPAQTSLVSKQQGASVRTMLRTGLKWENRRSKNRRHPFKEGMPAVYL
ncbi:hypothetical protein [Candidatus Soleaferrea massiliensis]|uniref:hypothetical protein n=1 Tax=Candidatus Soleaferrea massiliensis TaxID=1470354 RepID=UPI0012E02F8F|nr:hypothetical protein [Candidatus Soleaferrea massiliensis]